VPIMISGIYWTYFYGLANGIYLLAVAMCGAYLYSGYSLRGPRQVNDVKNVCGKFLIAQAIVSTLDMVVTGLQLRDAYPMLSQYISVIEIGVLMYIPLISKTLRHGKSTSLRRQVMMQSFNVVLLVVLYYWGEKMGKWIVIIPALGLAHVLVVYIVEAILLRYHEKHLKDLFSSLEDRTTDWFMQLTVPIMIVEVLWLQAFTKLPVGNVVSILCYPVVAAMMIQFTRYVSIQRFDHREQDIRIEGPDSLPEESAPQSADETPQWFSLMEQKMQSERLYNRPDLDIDQLAQEVMTNRTYLSRYLNVQRHQSFYDYVNTYRLNEACRLLVETDESIDAIAQQSGFNSGRSFQRVFKQQYDMPPGQWRALHKA